MPAQGEDAPSPGSVTSNGQRGGFDAPLVALRVVGRHLREGPRGIQRGEVVGLGTEAELVPQGKLAAATAPEEVEEEAGGS